MGESLLKVRRYKLVSSKKKCIKPLQMERHCGPLLQCNWRNKVTRVKVMRACTYMH